MNASIFIANFSEQVERVTQMMKMFEQYTHFKVSSMHFKNNMLRINTSTTEGINPEAIEQNQITCVVENELFRTIYLNGKRVEWRPLHA